MLFLYLIFTFQIRISFSDFESYTRRLELELFRSALCRRLYGFGRGFGLNPLLECSAWGPARALVTARVGDRRGQYRSLKASGTRACPLTSGKRQKVFQGGCRTRPTPLWYQSSLYAHSLHDCKQHIGNMTAAAPVAAFPSVAYFRLHNDESCITTARGDEIALLMKRFVCLCSQAQTHNQFAA